MVKERKTENEEKDNKNKTNDIFGWFVVHVFHESLRRFEFKRARVCMCVRVCFFVDVVI